TSRRYTRVLDRLYVFSSSAAENAIHRESGEKLAPLSPTSSFCVSRSSLPPPVSRRYRSLYRFSIVMFRLKRSGDCPRNTIHLLSGEITTSATEKEESSVRRFVFSPSRSRAHRLERGVSALRMLTVNFFSRRSFSSASELSLARK